MGSWALTLSRVTPSQLPTVGGRGSETVPVIGKRELLGAGSPLHKEGRKWGKL